MERINIIGAGLAGLSAAISLAEHGVACNLISVQPSERAQSVLAEGGINAALDTMGENDTVAEHFTDTMRGGVNLADPNAVARLVTGAPEIIQWLVMLGVPFQMDNGKLVLRNFGGQKKKRTAYAKSSSGKIIMSALIDEARKWEAFGMVTRFPHHEAVGLEIEEGQCHGLKMFDRYTDTLYSVPGTVILAMGGLNGMFPKCTTGTVRNTGNLTAALFAQGVAMSNLEFIQYHPTTVHITGKRMLISEAARGEGGRLFILRNGKPWYFMEELYPELGNLMPRDVISREITHVCARDDCGGQVYLDLTGISKAIWDKKLSDMREEIMDYLAIDLAKTPIAVSPGIHFFMGGIRVDEQHRMGIHGLYAAGECACQYHGANRLGGNSMLGAIYGGEVAAESAAADIERCRLSAEHQNAEIVDFGVMPDSMKKQLQVSVAAANKLRDILCFGLGIIRNREHLTYALQAIETLRRDDAVLTDAENNRMVLGEAMLRAALAREESRGAHCRTDYPRRDDDHFQKTTCISYRNGSIEVKFEEIPKRRTDHENCI